MRELRRECDGREYIEVIILAGYVFFNNLDCVLHDNDESTEVMMTKNLMIILYAVNDQEARSKRVKHSLKIKCD